MTNFTKTRAPKMAWVDGVRIATIASSERATLKDESRLWHEQRSTTKTILNTTTPRSADTIKQRPNNYFFFLEKGVVGAGKKIKEFYKLTTFRVEEVSIEKNQTVLGGNTSGRSSLLLRQVTDDFNYCAPTATGLKPLKRGIERAFGVEQYLETL